MQIFLNFFLFGKIVRNGLFYLKRKRSFELATFQIMNLCLTFDRNFKDLEFVFLRKIFNQCQ